MTPNGRWIRAACLALSLVFTAAVVAWSLPDRPLELTPLGDGAVNTVPAIRISLAGKPQPAATPAPEGSPYILYGRVPGGRAKGPLGLGAIPPLKMRVSFLSTLSLPQNHVKMSKSSIPYSNSSIHVN